MSRNSLSRPLILTALAALAFASVAGADFRLERELALSPGGTFILDSASGAIEIRGTDRDGARILITAKKGDVEERYTFTFEERGDDAVVKVEKRGSWTSRWFSGGDRLRFEIEVPRRVALDLKTAGGSIDAQQIQGRVDLRTSGGSVAITEIDGDVHANTSGGSIRAAGIAGDATVETSGGSVEILDVSGVIDAHTSGGSVRASFTAGNASGGSLSTSGGGITATIDPTVSLDVDARTSGGSVTSDLPLTVHGSLTRNTLRGQLNGGGAKLELRSSGGSIRLRAE